MSHRIVLDIEALDGPSQRRVFHTAKVTIGRSPKNDIQVAMRDRPDVRRSTGANCSRRHGMLEIRDRALVLHDMGTANGWHCLNDDLVAPHQHREGYNLKVGDRYYVGDTKISIVAFESDETAEPG